MTDQQAMPHDEARAARIIMDMVGRAQAVKTWNNEQLAWALERLADDMRIDRIQFAIINEAVERLVPELVDPDTGEIRWTLPESRR